MCILSKIQTGLVAPKNRYNGFGKYKYRSCETILEALKPLLKEHSATLLLSDDMVEIGGRVYVKSTATLTAKDNAWSATGFAREAETKKGMDDSQITGSTSSYSRKFALSGLLAIDDSTDADTTNREDTKLITEKQAADIDAIAADVGANVAGFLKFMKVGSVIEIPADKYEYAVKSLEAKRGQS